MPSSLSRRRGRSAVWRPALCALLLLGGCASIGSRTSGSLDDQTRLKLAAATRAGGDVVGSLAILRVVAEQSKDNVEAQLAYARALVDAGRDREALAVASRVQSRRPDGDAATLLIARLQLRLGEPDAALAGYRQAVAADRSNVAAWRGLGVAQAATGDLSGAEASFRSALSFAPGDAAARNDLALTLALTNRPAEAVSMLRELSRENDAPRIRHNLALAYAVAGERSRAVALLAPEVGEGTAAAAATEYARLADRSSPQRLAQLGQAPAAR